MMINVILAIALSTVVLFLGSGCEQQGPAEKAGERVDEAVQTSQNKVEDVVESAGDKVEDVVESAGDKLEAAGDKIQEQTQ